MKEKLYREMRLMPELFPFLKKMNFAGLIRRDSVKKRMLKVLSALLTLALFLAILSPFYVRRSAFWELSYTAAVRTGVEIIPLQNPVESPAQSLLEAGKYVLEPAEKLRTVSLEIPCDNRIRGLAFHFDRVPAPLKIFRAGVRAGGNFHPASLNSGEMVTYDKKNFDFSGGAMLIRPGRNLNVRYLPEKTLKISRRADPVMLLYMFLLSLLPALLVGVKADFPVTRRGAADLLYAAIALFLLVFPILLSDYYGRFSEEENRLKKDFPAIFRYQSFNDSFPRQFEEWFGDRFGGRKTAIRNQALLFGTSDHSGAQDAFFGREKWMFIRRWNSVAMFQNANRFSEEQLKNCAEKMLLLHHYFQQRNIRFYILLLPDKERIYPEYYPPEYRQLHPQSRLEQLSGYLAAHTAVKVISPLRELMELKKKHAVFHKTGTHWTSRAGHAGMEQLLREIRKDFPNLPSGQPNAEKWRKSLCADTDIARLLGYTDPEHQLPAEDLTGEEPEIRFPYRSKRLDGDNMSFFELTEYSAELPAPGALRIFACTDSFWRHAIPFAFPAARDMLHAFFGNGEKFDLNMLKNTICDYRPDIVILETTERFLDRLLTVGIEGD